MGIEAHKGVMGVNGMKAHKGRIRYPLAEFCLVVFMSATCVTSGGNIMAPSNSDTVGSHSLCLEGTMGPGLLGKGVEAGLGAVGRT